MRCGDTMASLINALYSLLLAQDQQLSDRYFLDWTILSARNIEVDEINASILSSVAPQQTDTYLSADSVTNPEYDYIPPEILHTFNLAHLDFLCTNSS